MIQISETVRIGWLQNATNERIPKSPIYHLAVIHAQSKKFFAAPLRDPGSTGMNRGSTGMNRVSIGDDRDEPGKTGAPPGKY
ncbi:hypothetical protein DPMN_145062 [Dreissena polymorpha]|uniref:Uncharacterized protein n=1 Tax=Dreissena polymorpha TaxID=45954 RepID=A0A9D4F493_DREPO|nr:hypothetical protein DPMN_145062 [Dreissena polymorpha]